MDPSPKDEGQPISHFLAAFGRSALPFLGFVIVLLAPARAFSAAPGDALGVREENRLSTGVAPEEDPSRNAAPIEEELRAADAAMARGDHAVAVEICERLRGDHPDDARVLLRLGRALAGARRYVEADEVLRGMEESRIDPIQAHLERGHLRERQGRLLEAERFYRNALQADGDNLEARIGMVRVKHGRGLARSALAQIDGIVMDFPDDEEARALQRAIHNSLRPRVEIDGGRVSDDDANRIDSATGAFTFHAEPQTSIRIEAGSHRAEFRCEGAARCDEVAGAQPVDHVVDTGAQILQAGLTARLIAPLSFHARAGAARQESFDGSHRTVTIGGGRIEWRVGPRFEIHAVGGREAMLDTAPLIDSGLRLDTADMNLQYHFHDRWILVGKGGYGSYSDGNARQTAAISVRWQLPTESIRIAGTVEARYRRFLDDRDGGYFDPRRYDAELVTLEVRDDAPDGRFYWRLSGTLGRQHFDMQPGSRLEAERDDQVDELYGAAGVRFGDRGSLEAFYSRSDDPFDRAVGFTTSRAGFTLRIRT